MVTKLDVAGASWWPSTPRFVYLVDFNCEPFKQVEIGVFEDPRGEGTGVAWARAGHGKRWRPDTSPNTQVLEPGVWVSKWSEMS